VHAFERFKRESYERKRERERERRGGGGRSEGRRKKQRREASAPGCIGADSFVGFPHLHAPTR